MGAMQPMTADPRWERVVARDPSADPGFVYSVRTTGVYCRPSCPARRPLPGNVQFHASAAEAARAGFRACLRCRPDAAPDAEREGAIVAAACRTIEASDQPLPLAVLARAAGLSVRHFHRVFRAVAGLTPRAYTAGIRSRRLRDGLAAAGSVTEAAYAAGFNASSRFYEAADASLGMTPRAWRAGGAGEVITFALAACSLGAILVARSGRGVCAISLGDDPKALERALQTRFPRAALRRGEPGSELVVAQVVAMVEQPGMGHSLPLDLRGTAFQLRVWQALAALPAGETVSYAALAQRLGSPGGARAVAAACASNPVAVAVPCHRVVRTDGDPAGYRWGVERKRVLLDREASGTRPGDDPATAASTPDRARQASRAEAPDRASPVRPS